MKKLLKNPLTMAIFLITVYLLGLVLGACAVSAYPLSRQKDFLMKQAQRIAREYSEDTRESFDLWLDGKIRVLIYGAEGNCLLDITASPDSKPSVPHEKYVPSVLAGSEVYKLEFAEEPFPMLHGLMGVAGTPITEQGRVTGAVFLVRKTIAVTESLVGYFVYFTLFYWLSVFFIVSNIRKNKKLDELRQNYIANVTHAFKTPIASIMALAETLCDGVEPDPDRQKVYYGMILREANRQHHMIQDVLELSKLQSNGMDFTKTNVCAAEVFDPVLNKYATLCDCMGISLHISEEISRLPPLYTNPACVKQLLEILLDNALKFVHEGGDIWVEAACTRNKATICVRDNGIGIAKEALPHVFERFYKCSHDFNESGSGLGLAIAEEIVSGLKEKIWAESEPGKGAAFFFTVHHR